MTLDEPTELSRLIGASASAAELAACLDDASAEVRKASVMSLGRREQRSLWALTEPAPPLTPEDFVPAGLPTLHPVAHHGLNTLPLPLYSLKRFTKWMVRTGQGDEIGGWNDSPFALPIGPGYFVMRPTVGDEQRRAAMVVDYHQVPRGPVPDGWPWVRPNWLGPQLFVYGHTRDYMRRVSSHVTIGAATKWGVSLGSWFVLVREP